MGALEKTEVHNGTLSALLSSVIVNADDDGTSRRVGPIEGSSGATKGAKVANETVRSPAEDPRYGRVTPHGQ
jgi:hypothetical protein